jgi:hypothetical protein
MNGSTNFGPPLGGHGQARTADHRRSQHSPGDPRDGKLTAKSAGCVRTSPWMPAARSVRLNVRWGCYGCCRQALSYRTTRRLMVEILKDNGRPEAGAVYGAMDTDWAKLVGQIAQANAK